MIGEQENYIEKLLSFNEKESKKFISINNIFKSKLFLSFIILYIAYNLLSLSSYVVTIVQNPSNSTIIFSQILSIVLSSIVPFFFARLLILQHINNKKEANERNPVFKRLLSIIKFAKVLLVFVGIVTILGGIYYVYLSSMIQISDDVYEYFYSLGYTLEDIRVLKNTGYMMLIESLFNFFLAYSFSKTSKIMISSIVLDYVDEEIIDVNTNISIVIISLYAFYNLLSLILRMIGIESIISVFPIKEYNVTEICFIIGCIISIAYMIIGIILLDKIRKGIKNNVGSTNPLYSDVVYTIKIDEDKE